MTWSTPETPDNVQRLGSALEELDAVYRFQRTRPLRPNASHLASAGHHLLETRFGDCDFRGAIADGADYGALLPHTVTMEVAPGLSVLVLNLETLIRAKEITAGDKDHAVLPILRRTLEERNRMI